MKKTIFWVLILAVSFLFVELFPKNAEALPTFARKYKTACITCHATFPRLTALGEAVRLNGYKMPDGDELYIKDQPLSMGVSAYKKVFPEAVWPSDIPGMPPIAIRVIGDLEYDIGDDASDRDNDYRIEFPHEVEIFFAGSFGESMSFFGEIEFEEPSSPSTSFKAWLMWEDVIAENIFNIKAGNIGMQEIDLPNTRNHNRITRSKYLTHEKITMPLAGPGLEVNGFGKVWRYATGIVKPQGTFGDPAFYLTGSLKFGGLGYDGSGGTTEEGGLETTPSGYWRDDSVLLGGFYFKGDDYIDRYGVDARFNVNDLSLAAGYLKEDHEASNLDENILFAEAEYFVYPWLQPYVRYETLDADAVDSDEARVVIGTVLLARANVKINVEGKFYTENDTQVAAGKDKNVDNRLYVRLDYAF
ncbi:MAG: hypothetical protein V3S49_03060 [Thermodesulfobacteriota bacterium]